MAVQGRTDYQGAGSVVTFHDLAGALRITSAVKRCRKDPSSRIEVQGFRHSENSCRSARHILEDLGHGSQDECKWRATSDLRFGALGNLNANDLPDLGHNASALALVHGGHVGVRKLVEVQPSCKVPAARIGNQYRNRTRTLQTLLEDPACRSFAFPSQFCTDTHQRSNLELPKKPLLP